MNHTAAFKSMKGQEATPANPRIQATGCARA